YKDVALNNSNGLSDKSIISLYEDDDDKIWIGTDGGGINLYDPHTDQFTHFPSTYGDKVASIANISEKELMVSLYTKGIFIFNKITGTYRPFTIVDEGTNYKECCLSKSYLYKLTSGNLIPHYKP
ncbi:two-component regulator propeller domain-containing protein, partial [Phocaeicola vulgatus]|uniref:two-component regulator propeller domain-containing protein n=1 Tax=Phocaeicola vulgatus TaxID=821 RepID=UPI0023B08292